MIAAKIMSRVGTRTGHDMRFLPAQRCRSPGATARVVAGSSSARSQPAPIANGAMFDPPVALLRDRFRMLIPDLRGHGRSGDLAGPYDVAALAADLDIVLAEGQFDRAAVLGYSHGGAVAQELAHVKPEVVSRLILACTYACNTATRR